MMLAAGRSQHQLSGPVHVGGRGGAGRADNLPVPGYSCRLGAAPERRFARLEGAQVTTTTLGSYELGDVLGRGAMGEVRRAVRAGSTEGLAVKVLRPELSEDPELIARFVQERTVLCSLHHPNLVRVHDLVIEGGSAVIVMDLVDGLNLRQLLKERGTLPAAEAARVVSELLSALSVVHGKGIVHRDIKPENVLVGPTGEVHLTDFGIARLAQGPSLTRVTGLIGTPDYLAPELANHEHAAPAADIYATGILFYELLTGFTPFSGVHPVAVLRRHLEEDPPRPDGIPDDLWGLLAEMLAKGPDARPAADDVAKRLRTMAPVLKAMPALLPVRPAWGDEKPTAPRPGAATFQERPTVVRGSRPATTPPGPRRTRARRTAAIVAAVVVVGGLVGAAIGLGSSPGLTGRRHTFSSPSRTCPGSLSTAPGCCQVNRATSSRPPPRSPTAPAGSSAALTSRSSPSRWPRAWGPWRSRPPQTRSSWRTRWSVTTSTWPAVPP